MNGTDIDAGAVFCKTGNRLFFVGLVGYRNSAHTHGTQFKQGLSTSTNDHVRLDQFLMKSRQGLSHNTGEGKFQKYFLQFPLVHVMRPKKKGRF